MGTGIEPLPGEDYDIDVGLNFHLSKNNYLPVQVKQWVDEFYYQQKILRFLRVNIMTERDFVRF